MKKSSISYNNILPKKKKSQPAETKASTTVKTSTIPTTAEYNFEKILKKHVIFKSKVPSQEIPTTKSPDQQTTNESPSKLGLRKRPTAENNREDEVTSIDSQLCNLKKRFKLKAIEMFDNSFEDETTGNIFDMPEKIINKSSESKTTNTKKSMLKANLETKKEVKTLKNNSESSFEEPTENNVLVKEEHKPVNKENIESGTKPKKTSLSPKKTKSPQKLVSKISPQLENPYKKVYPEKKIRLNLNRSLTDEEDFKFDLQKITVTRSKLEQMLISKTLSSPEADKVVENKVDNSKLNNPTKYPPKTFSVKVNTADLSDEDFDEIDTKKLIFKKKIPDEKKSTSTSVQQKSNKIFSAKFYEDLDDLDTCSKLVIKKKSVTSPAQPELTVKANNSPDIKTNKRKLIFSSKRHTNEESKAMMFNLNPNIEDINYKMKPKESLNDAVVYNSNSSCSNSPISAENSASSEIPFNNFEGARTSKTGRTLNSKKTSTSPRSSTVTSSDKSDSLLEIEFELRNSRKAYECEELGENQAFLDDIEYLFDGLNNNYKLNDRCLCAIKLAESCLSSEFRMNLRLSKEYINRIFRKLTDAVNYQSLALCTSLIMFALSQDKLIMEIEKDTFNLILSIVNMNPISNSKSNTPVGINKKYKSKYGRKQQPAQESKDSEEFNDDKELYKKLFSRCKDLTEKLTNSGNEKSIQDTNSQRHQIFFSSESCDTSLDTSLKSNKSLDASQETTTNYCDEFNAQLLAIECIFNMHLNKQHNVPVDWYKNELRTTGIFDKLIQALSATFRAIKQSKGSRTCSFYFNKYLRYFNFLESVMQSSTSALASFNIITAEAGNSQKKLKAIASSVQEIEDEKLPVSVLNQNYLINYKNHFFVGLIKESLMYFYDEIIEIKQAKLPNESKQTLILSSIKVNLLLVINLTHNNVKVCKQIEEDEELINLIFKCISKIVHHLNKDEQFDLLIMSMSILLNIFDSNSASSMTVVLAKNMPSYEIIIDLYKDKENLVSLAEHDQDNEFKQLAEQLESQNEDNINTAIMNSIHKAGKHMEDHLIAAYSALLIGHIMKNHSDVIEQIRLKMKDNSFKYMALIIRKFLVFMKIMNVNGFSADQNVNKIIKFLESN